MKLPKKGSNAELGGITLQNFRKIADGPADEIWTSKIDLDYAYGQLFLSREARNLCTFAVTGDDFIGYYRFLKGFYGLADIPTIFQAKIDQTLENKHPAWLDDIIIVTKGSKEQHKKELIEVLTRPETPVTDSAKTNPNSSNQKSHGLATKSTKMESDRCKTN